MYIIMLLLKKNSHTLIYFFKHHISYEEPKMDFTLNDDII
jgi:hypothetical protein